MNRDKSSRDAGNRNGNVEGQVRGVLIRDRHSTLNVGGDASVRRDEELNLTEVADVAADAGDWGTDGLAHVTEEGRVRRIGGSGESGRKRTRRGGHVASGVVTNSASGRDELVRIGGGGAKDGGSAVVGVVGLDLTNETGNGRHLIFRT